MLDKNTNRQREHEELTCREEPRENIGKIGKISRKPLEKRILDWPKTVLIVKTYFSDNFSGQFRVYVVESGNL